MFKITCIVDKMQNWQKYSINLNPTYLFVPILNMFHCSIYWKIAKSEHLNDSWAAAWHWVVLHITRDWEHIAFLTFVLVYIFRPVDVEVGVGVHADAHVADVGVDLSRIMSGIVETH